MLYFTAPNITALYCYWLHFTGIPCTIIDLNSHTAMHYTWHHFRHCTALQCPSELLPAMQSPPHCQKAVSRRRSHSPALHCTVHPYTLLHFTVQYITTFSCTALFSTLHYTTLSALYSAIHNYALLHCTVQYITALSCTALYSTSLLLLHCTVQYTTLHSTLLHCTLQYITTLSCT